MSDVTGCRQNSGVRLHMFHCICQTLKHFDNVFATGGNNIVEVFESLLTSFLNDGHTVVLADIEGHLTLYIILAITNAINKNLPSSGTKWLPIMTYIHPPNIGKFRPKLSLYCHF